MSITAAKARSRNGAKQGLQIHECCRQSCTCRGHLPLPKQIISIWLQCWTVLMSNAPTSPHCLHRCFSCLFPMHSDLLSVLLFSAPLYRSTPSLSSGCPISLPLALGWGHTSTSTGQFSCQEPTGCGTAPAKHFPLPPSEKEQQRNGEESLAKKPTAQINCQLWKLFDKNNTVRPPAFTACSLSPFLTAPSLSCDPNPF